MGNYVDVPGLDAATDAAVGLTNTINDAATGNAGTEAATTPAVVGTATPAQDTGKTVSLPLEQMKEIVANEGFNGVKNLAANNGASSVTITIT